MTAVAEVILRSSLFLFAIVGGFGNANIIVATWRKKEIQHKCGILLALLAFCDLSCLAFELLSAVRMVAGSASMNKVACFWLQSPYIFIENVEVYMIFAVSIDRQVAIAKPLRYTVWPTTTYLILICLPGVIYGLFYLTWSYVTLRPQRVEVCNLPTAMPEHVSEMWNYTSLAACVMTVICYLCTYLLLYSLSPRFLKSDTAQINQQKRILNTLSINVFGFFISSVVSAGIILLYRNIGVSDETIADAETYAVIPGLISYSINFYIYFWRSSEYRRAFCQQLHISEDMFGGQRAHRIFSPSTMSVAPVRTVTANFAIS